MHEITGAAVTIGLAVIGLAIVATVLSRNANTVGVLHAAGSAFGNSLGVAESPVTGVGYQLNLGYPASTDHGYSFGG
jgi:hypothetical protein